MFCPKCRAEYVNGIKKCADCGVELVAELPELRETEPWEDDEPEESDSTDQVEFEELLITSYADVIALVKSVLDGADIAYYFTNEHYAMVPPGAEPARLMVRKDQIDEARKLLEDMQFRSQNPSTDE